MPLSGLTLSNLTPGSVTLSWDTGGLAPAEGYGVFRGAPTADDDTPPSSERTINSTLG